MVRGLPQIEHVDQVCDSCLIGKQRRALFPQAAKYQAEDRIDLVHGDLCKPITPSTHGGKRNFLFLVDDMNRLRSSTRRRNSLLLLGVTGDTGP